MSDGKRKSQGKDRSRRRYRPDGTPIWGQRSVDGPGVWVTCVKGKEKQTVGELYDLFESVSSHMFPRAAKNEHDPQLASEIWPDSSNETPGGNDSGSDEADDGDVEKQIAREMLSMKRPRKEQRFGNCQTNTQCVVFISCKPPVDPVQLVMKHVRTVMDTGVTHTRFTQRLTPISATCVANLPEIKSLFNRVVSPFFEEDPERTYHYKIELRMRNHSTIARPILIQELAKCVPEKHKVDLENAEAFILVEVFKSICGISIVKDYYRFQKFNVMEIANAKNESAQGEGRIADKG
ncbi:uncharacterized protein FIBRA_05216 [Fibroporia radiculosa]|uniref:THUMP domain-containing protein n=1 Tax=Fibroporia radiculosa TaxID=599839 RepID=J4IAL0_9APHY|nr:uncharacterized protein FIBRA_05216 [Fibroporia radiculosa]CCM03096.1 predicted protein [Fibroporia radiculosa]